MLSVVQKVVALTAVRTSLEEFGRRPNFSGSTNEVPSVLLTHQSLLRRKAEVTRVSKEIGQVRANQKKAKSDAKSEVHGLVDFETEETRYREYGLLYESKSDLGGTAQYRVGMGTRWDQGVEPSDSLRVYHHRVKG